MLQPRWSDLLGVEYITIKGTHITSTGVLLTQPELSDLKGQPKKVQDLYHERLKRTLYDYEYARRTAIIRQSPSPNTAVLQESIDVPRPAPVEDQTEVLTPEAQRKAVNIPIRILRVTMLVVALLCIPISMYNIFEATVQSLPVAVALVFSFALSVFVTGSFESVFLMWRSNKALAVMLAVFCSLAISYAMTSTLESFYRGYMTKRENRVQEITKTIEDKASGKAGRAATRTALAFEQYTKAKDYYEGIKDDASVASWRVAVASKAVDTAKAEYDKALKDEDVVEETTEQTATRVTDDSKDFYDKVDEYFGWKQGKAHMLVALIPTIFIDIVAPLSTAVALFLDDTTSTPITNSKSRRKGKGKWNYHLKQLAANVSKRLSRNPDTTTSPETL